MAADETTREEILKYYQTGSRSIQDLARIFGVSVDEVLHITGNGELSSVFMPGDMIDASEAGPKAEMNYGRDIKVPFTVD